MQQRPSVLDQTVLPAEPGNPKPVAGSLKPVRWRCRRGMKELDVLLERYFDRRFKTASVSEQAAFLTLLSMPDPTLMDFVMGRKQPKDSGIKNVVFELCQPHT